MIDTTPAGARPAEPPAGPALLHLDASAGPPEESVTRHLTSLFVDTWRDRQGTPERAPRYRYRDLAADPVPLATPGYAALGRRVERHGGIPPHKVSALVDGPDEEREWALTLPLIEELRAADTLLLGVPMYNFSVPATLKAWIDRVTFPAAFTDPDTGDPLLRGTRVVAVLARGGAYGPGTPRHDHDFQAPYLRAYFTSLGIAPDDIHLVAAEMTIADLVPALARFQDMAAESLRAARGTVRELALAERGGERGR